MSACRLVLVCFAVREEAAAFKRIAGSRPQVKVLLTGMGPRNAEQAIRAALTKERPGLVMSCGFAGGLKPELATGTVLFTADGETGLEPALVAAGARPGRFHCAEQVATTAGQKRALREKTESEVIRAICREQQVPSATLRVVLDAADEDLPLDFNALMTPDQRMSCWKLAGALLRSPAKIGVLLRLQKRGEAAAEKLAAVLERATAALG